MYQLFVSYAHYVFTAPSDTTPTQVTAETELPSEVYYNQGKAINKCYNNVRNYIFLRA